MEAVYYTSIKGNYIVQSCTMDDIPIHIEKVKATLASVGDTLYDEDSYIGAMIESIYQGHAKKVTKNNILVGFVYFRFDSEVPNRLIGSSIWIPNDMLAFLLLGFFHRVKSTKAYPYNQILMLPHGNNIKFFKSMCESGTLRGYNAGSIDYVLFDMNRRLKFFNNLRKIYNLKKVAPWQ